MKSNIEWLLRAAAAAQLGVAAVNLSTVRLLKWHEPLERMPPLMREVFWVHTWFVSVVLAIFAVMTWRFGSEMAGGANAACAWLAAAIGIVWGLRTAIQVAYYSPAHWRGNTGRTIIHIVLFVVYGGMSVTYLAAASLWFTQIME